MKRLTCWLTTLVTTLLVLLPALVFADPADDINNSRRSRMLRRGVPAAAAPAERPAITEPKAETPQNVSADATFGYTKENPIKMGGADLSEGIAGSKYYLRSLRDKHNKPFAVSRISNVGPGEDGHIVDLYQLIDSEGTSYKLYIDVYHPEIHPKEAKTPQGMTR
ncbi:hypothetical protein [Trichlorobacter lovleyi]|uniref:hypothetical protein n=1 Tax=Trichlorobacter lovleyi TaxID=313985 RepID=UPI0024815C75|nr:hypothetical protein [Trichlorobacter lovleyi]